MTNYKKNNEKKDGARRHPDKTRKPLRLQAESKALAEERRRLAQAAAPPVEPKVQPPVRNEQETAPSERRGGFQSQHGGFSHREGFQSHRSGFKGSSTRPSDKGAPTLNKVHTSQMVEVSDRLGRTSSRLTNTSIGGGSNTNWIAPSNEGGYWGTGMDSRSVNYWIDRMKEETGCSSFSFILIPNKEEMFDKVANDAVQRRVTNSSGRTDEGKPQGLPQVEGTLNEVKAWEDCPYCDRKGHALASCFCKYPKGELVGCVICNVKDHLMDNCMLFKSMNLAEKVNWLVIKRANKPPIQTEESWYVTLHKYCMSDSFDRKSIRGFPWTVGFARKMFKPDRTGYRAPLGTMQRRYDEPGRKCRLPIDEATASFEAVSYTYWRDLGLPWPPVLGDMEVEMADCAGDVDDMPLANDGRVSQYGSPAPSDDDMPIVEDGRVAGDAPQEEYGDPKEDETDFTV